MTSMLFLQIQRLLPFFYFSEVLMMPMKWVQPLPPLPIHTRTHLIAT